VTRHYRPPLYTTWPALPLTSSEMTHLGLCTRRVFIWDFYHPQCRSNHSSASHSNFSLVLHIPVTTMPSVWPRIFGELPFDISSPPLRSPVPEGFLIAQFKPCSTTSSTVLVSLIISFFLRQFYCFERANEVTSIIQSRLFPVDTKMTHVNIPRYALAVRLYLVAVQRGRTSNYTLTSMLHGVVGQIYYVSHHSAQVTSFRIIGSVYKDTFQNTTENENIVIIKVHSFALNIQNSDGCHVPDSYQLLWTVEEMLGSGVNGDAV
jgi:hypothetical protein